MGAADPISWTALGLGHSKPIQGDWFLEEVFQYNFSASQKLETLIF